MAERIKRKKLTETQAQGKLDVSVQAGSVQSIPEGINKINQQQMSPVDEVRQKGLLRRAAEIGLYPAAAGAKLISGTESSVKDIVEATADRPVGYALGLGTVAAASVLGVRGAGKLAGAAKVPKRLTGLLGNRSAYSRVSTQAIEREAAKAGLSKNAIAQVTRELGKQRVSQVAMNVRNAQGTLLGKYVRGAFSTKRVGSAILLGWLGADTIAQSTSFQASKIESNVIFGQMSPAQGLNQLEVLESYNNAGKAAILAAAAISPASIPFLIFGWQSTKLADSQLEKSKQIIGGY